MIVETTEDERVAGLKSGHEEGQTVVVRTRKQEKFNGLNCGEAWAICLCRKERCVCERRHAQLER